MLTMLLQKMAHRRDLLKSEDCVNIDDYAKKTGQSIPRCIFACDEVAEILDKAGADADRKKNWRKSSVYSLLLLVRAVHSAYI